MVFPPMVLVNGSSRFAEYSSKLTNMVTTVVTARSAHVAMANAMMGYALAYIFPIYVNVFNKETMDTRRDTTLNVDTVPTDKEMELERNLSNDAGNKGAVEISETKQ